MNYQIGEHLTFMVNRAPGDQRPRRLADYVGSRLGISGKRANRLCALGAVRFNDMIISTDTNAPLMVGDAFSVLIPADWLPHLAATEMPLTIIYEDDFLVAVDKPFGLLVHSARGHLFGNALQNGIIHHCRHDLRKDKVVAPPHRLDKDTSGVIIFSKIQRVYRELCNLFRRREVKKKYLAIVEGVVEWNEITVDVPLGVNPQNPKIGAVVAVENGGKNAITRLTVLRRSRDCSLIAVEPLTGRAHQIRLHLQHLGFPLIGDRDYNPYSKIAFPRQALHAAELQLTHPFTREKLSLTAPLAPDLMEFATANFND